MKTILLIIFCVFLLIEIMLVPEQCEANIAAKAGNIESVEFAVKFEKVDVPDSLNGDFPEKLYIYLELKKLFSNHCK